MLNIKKFDVLIADFDPKQGSKESGIRSCVVLQSNVFNKTSSTIIVVPLTSNVVKIFPSEFIITPSSNNGLSKTSRFLGSQITVIDKIFVIKKLGTLEEKYHSQVYEAINLSLDLENMFLEY